MAQTEKETKSIPTLWPRRFLQSIVLFSGAAALLYELGLERSLELSLGVSAYAITIVLTCFFLGLTLGALFARRLLSAKDILKSYAIVELSVAVSAWLAFWLFSLNSSLLSPNLSHFDLGRLLLVVLILLPPMVLIGTTLPLIIQIYRYLEPSSQFARLYGLNTLGGALAVLLATAWVLPVLGTQVMLLIALVFNVSIAGMSCYLSKQVNARGVFSNKLARPEAKILLFASVIGFIAIGFETLATRLTILQVGSSVYALAFVILAVLSGIALGSFIASKTKDKHKLLVSALILAVAFLLITFFIYPHIGTFTAHIAKNTSNVWLTSVILAFILTFPVSSAIGAILPALVWTNKKNDVGEEAAWLVGANTFGGALAPLTFTFILIPIFGLQYSLLIIVAVVCFGVIALVQAPINNRVIYALIAIAIIFGAGKLFSWSPAQLSAGPLINSKLPAPTGKIIFHKQGVLAYVTVEKSPTAGIGIIVNGKEDAGPADLETDYLLGYLPELFTNDYKNALVIGLGGGVTAGALTQYPYSSIDVSEVEPAVYDASKYFGQYNHDYWKDSRIHVSYSSGQNLLTTTSKKYNVITSGPTNSWITGVSSLYTKQFLTIAQSKLAPGGVMMQWLNSNYITASELEETLATFQSVFPYTYVFSTLVTNDILMVGTTKPINVSSSQLAAWWNKAGPDLTKADIDTPEEFSAIYAFGPAQVRALSSGSSILSINKPQLEYQTPLNILANNAPELLALFLNYQQPASQLGVAFNGSSFASYTQFTHFTKQAVIDLSYPTATSYDDAITELTEAIAIYPHPYYISSLVNLYLLKAQAAYNSGDVAAYNNLINIIIRLDPSAASHLTKIQTQ